MLAGEFTYKLDQISKGQKMVLFSDLICPSELPLYYDWLFVRDLDSEKIKSEIETLLTEKLGKPHLVQGVLFEFNKKLQLWENVEYSQEPAIIRLLFSIVKSGYRREEKQWILMHLCLGYSLSEIGKSFEKNRSDLSNLVNTFLNDRSLQNYPFVFPQGDYLQKLNLELTGFFDGWFHAVLLKKDLSRVKKESFLLSLTYLLEHCIDTDNEAFTLLNDLASYFFFKLAKLNQILDEKGNAVVWYLNKEEALRIDYYQRAVSYLIEINEKDRLSNFKLLSGIEALHGVVDQRFDKLKALYDTLVLVDPRFENLLMQAYYSGKISNPEYGINRIIDLNANHPNRVNVLVQFLLADLYEDCNQKMVSKSILEGVIHHVRNVNEHHFLIQKIND